jgi:uncharacterized protein (DUF1501 family)
MGHKISAAQIEGPIATLVQDLKQRGLLQDTLVIVASEFGRTPVINLGGFRSVHNGRDHNIYGFTVLLAGAGLKAGMIYGKTDDFGFKVAESGPRARLTGNHPASAWTQSRKPDIPHSGRNFRLTDVEGRVVNAILA